MTGQRHSQAKRRGYHRTARETGRSGKSHLRQRASFRRDWTPSSRKRAAGRSILGFEAKDRPCRNWRAQRGRSPRPPIMRIGISQREDHYVERKPRVRGNMQRKDVATLHGELIDQALGQGGPALVRTFLASNDFDSAVAFSGSSLPFTIENRLEYRRATESTRPRSASASSGAMTGGRARISWYSRSMASIAASAAATASSALSSSSRIAACSS